METFNKVLHKEANNRKTLKQVRNRTYRTRTNIRINTSFFSQNSRIHTLIMFHTNNHLDFCCGVESVWRICINIIDYIPPQAFWFSWYYWVYIELRKKSVSQEAYQSGSPITLKPLTDRRSRLQGTGTSGNIGSWPSWGSSLTNQTFPNISPLHTDCAVSPQKSTISAMPLFSVTLEIRNAVITPHCCVIPDNKQAFCNQTRHDK